MQFKTSYPKLHSIKFKSGISASNVVLLHPEATEDINPDYVLIGALENRVKNVIVLGESEGSRYIASSSINNREVIGALMESMILILLNIIADDKNR